MSTNDKKVRTLVTTFMFATLAQGLTLSGFFSNHSDMTSDHFNSLVYSASATSDGGESGNGEEGGGESDSGAGDDGGSDGEDQGQGDSDSQPEDEADTTDEDTDIQPEDSLTLGGTDALQPTPTSGASETPVPPSTPTQQGLAKPSEICGNGQDDDGDGQIDGLDSDCSTQQSTTSPTPGALSILTPNAATIRFCQTSPELCPVGALTSPLTPTPTPTSRGFVRAIPEAGIGVTEPEDVGEQVCRFFGGCKPFGTTGPPQDPGVTGPGYAPPEGRISETSGAACTNEFDDDGDGKSDSQDEDCQPFLAGETIDPEGITLPTRTPSPTPTPNPLLGAQIVEGQDSPLGRDLAKTFATQTTGEPPGPPAEPGAQTPPPSPTGIATPPTPTTTTTTPPTPTTTTTTTTPQTPTTEPPGSPTDITVTETAAGKGAVVTYPLPQGINVVCSPASGSIFPAGTTTVTCTDDGGVIATFKVTVSPGSTTSTTLSQGTPTPTPTQTPTPTPLPTTTTITNVNNNQVTVTNGQFTVQDRTGALTATSDCSPQDKTILLGPSTMQSGGARLLATFDPCVLADGTVALNIPDEEGIQVVAANLQGNQATQSAIIQIQRVAPIAEGQTLYQGDLSGQVTGPDPATGNPVTLNGNINALFLWNGGGQNVELVGDNGVGLNAILRK